MVEESKRCSKVYRTTCSKTLEVELLQQVGEGHVEVSSAILGYSVPGVHYETVGRSRQDTLVSAPHQRVSYQNSKELSQADEKSYGDTNVLNFSLVCATNV